MSSAYVRRPFPIHTIHKFLKKNVLIKISNDNGAFIENTQNVSRAPHRNVFSHVTKIPIIPEEDEDEAPVRL